MTRKFQLSRIKSANLPFIAAEIEAELKYAPGNKKPLPPPVSKRRKPTRNMKLELADAEISRCGWCGAWTTEHDLCAHCKSHKYPFIDLERTA